jgi:hypothetical protein
MLDGKLGGLDCASHAELVAVEDPHADFSYVRIFELRPTDEARLHVFGGSAVDQDVPHACQHASAGMALR